MTEKLRLWLQSGLSEAWQPDQDGLLRGERLWSFCLFVFFLI